MPMWCNSLWCRSFFGDHLLLPLQVLLKGLRAACCDRRIGQSWNIDISWEWTNILQSLWFWSVGFLFKLQYWNCLEVSGPRWRMGDKHNCRNTRSSRTSSTIHSHVCWWEGAMVWSPGWSTPNNQWRSGIDWRTMENCNWLEHFEVVINTWMSHNNRMQSDAAKSRRWCEASFCTNTQ